MNKIGVLFDLDGVLIDSEGLYTKFWEDIEKIYPTGVDNFTYKIKGNALFKILDTYFNGEDVKNDIIARAHEFERTIVYPIYYGVIEFLSELKEQNVSVAVVTSSDDVKMDYLFKQYPDFKQYFDVIITGSMVTESKPHPQGYLLAAEKLGCNISDCFVFEDSLQGLDAGMASGATVIGLTTSNPEELIKNKAHKIINGFVGFGIKDMLLLKH